VRVILQSIGAIGFLLMENEYLRSKFAELRRQFAKTKILPVICNDLMLEDASVDGAYLGAEDKGLKDKPLKDNSKDPKAFGEYKFLIYLAEAQNIRLCIPQDIP
jgi:hypothetical protein